MVVPALLIAFFGAGRVGLAAVAVFAPDGWLWRASPAPEKDAADVSRAHCLH